MQGVDGESTEFRRHPPTRTPRLLLSLFALVLLWWSHKVRPPAAIYKCPTLFLPLSRRPLAPLVTGYHRQSPAALFTLGAVAEMCHCDVMLHTPADKNRQTLFTHVAAVSPLTTGRMCTRTRTGKDTRAKKRNKNTHTQTCGHQLPIEEIQLLGAIGFVHLNTAGPVLGIVVFKKTMLLRPGWGRNVVGVGVCDVRPNK